jgi:hypothetical protein
MPLLARLYGIPPKDQAGLTLAQFRALQHDYRWLQQEGGD